MNILDNFVFYISRADLCRELNPEAPAFQASVQTITPLRLKYYGNLNSLLKCLMNLNDTNVRMFSVMLIDSLVFHRDRQT